MFASLEQRRSDWGISPASIGLSLARGEYVCFLSDDNGYAPGHFDELVPTLDHDSDLGFVYSSCLYDGKWVLNDSHPAWGKIDLGQPLFRRDLFDRYLGGTLPFYEYGWDWRMIDIFLRNRVQWKHIDRPTFIFRLAKYPEFNQDTTSQPA
jgi:glycosyltransferase involved in cell wall biosynthesis